MYNGDVVRVQAAIQAGANVNSIGPQYGYYLPSSPLITCNYSYF